MAKSVLLLPTVFCSTVLMPPRASRSASHWRRRSIEADSGCARGGSARSACSRTDSRLRPYSCSSLAANGFSSRSRPSSKCSVPICLWFRPSASSAPYDRTRLHSWLSGKSTEAGTFSPRACAARSVCGWPPRQRESEGSGSPTPCPRAAALAANVRSRYKDCRTG